MGRNDLPSTDLYPRLLGPAWQELNEAVRRLHADETVIHASGYFEVRQGANRICRRLARWAGLPAAEDRVPVLLSIVPDGQEEEWRRRFAGQPLVSRQSARPDGLLAEQMGRLELRFKLKVVAGDLHYTTTGSGLRIGPVFVPLPGWLGPRMEAWETSADEPGCVFVRVGVYLPLFGLLIAYQGPLKRDETIGEQA